MIILHHGSNVQVETIDLSLANPGKDFGKGFYLNPDYNQAFEWAESRVKIFTTGEPIVSSFEFDLDKATRDGLAIKVFEDYTVEWAEFVVGNRRNASDSLIHAYDIVIGPIANDNVGRQIQLYMQGYWTVEQLIEKIKFTAKKSVQYFFANEKALTYLQKSHG